MSDLLEISRGPSIFSVVDFFVVLCMCVRCVYVYAAVHSVQFWIFFTHACILSRGPSGQKSTSATSGNQDFLLQGAQSMP